MHLHNLVAWLEEHDKLAGWAQFLGGVAAILAAYLIAKSEQWVSRSQSDRHQAMLEVSAAKIAGKATAAIRHTLDHVIDENNWPIIPSGELPLIMFDHVVKMIDSFPVHEHDDGRVGFELFSFEFQLQGARVFAENATRSIKESGSLSKSQHDALILVRENIVKHAESYISTLNDVARFRLGIWRRMLRKFAGDGDDLFRLTSYDG